MGRTPLENPGIWTLPLKTLESPWIVWRGPGNLEINIMVRNATYSQNITVRDAMYSSNISIIIGPCQSVCAQYPRSIQRTIQFMRRWYLWVWRRVDCPKRAWWIMNEQEFICILCIVLICLMYTHQSDSTICRDLITWLYLKKSTTLGMAKKHMHYNYVLRSSLRASLLMIDCTTTKKNSLCLCWFVKSLQ
jgi:hypothetical protein